MQFHSFRRGLLRYAARHNSTGSIPGRNAKLRSGVALFHYTLRAMPLVPFPLRSGTRHSMPRNHFSIPISRRDAALHAATRLFIPIPQAPLHRPQPPFAPIARLDSLHPVNHSTHDLQSVHAVPPSTRSLLSFPPFAPSSRHPQAKPGIFLTPDTLFEKPHHNLYHVLTHV